MQSAGFQDFLQRLTDFRPRSAVISSINISNRLEWLQCDGFRHALADVDPVLFVWLDQNTVSSWQQVTTYLIEAGIREYLFIGRGHVPGKEQDLQFAYILQDQINLSGESPLIGVNRDHLGPRFPDMTDLYHREYRQRLMDISPYFNLECRETILLIPRDGNRLSTLEEDVLEQAGTYVISRDVFSGAVCSKHAGCRGAGIIFTSSKIPAEFIDFIIDFLKS